jgi:hypothetical protein
VGPAGKDGVDGAGALEAAACTTHVGRAGTVSISVGTDDVLTLTCIKIPTWCEANTPTGRRPHARRVRQHRARADLHL